MSCVIELIEHALQRYMQYDKASRGGVTVGACAGSIQEDNRITRGRLIPQQYFVVWSTRLT